MRKSIYTLLLLLCCTAAMAQVAPAPPITQFNQNSVYIENITKDRYLFHGKDALGHPIWTRIPFVLSPNTVISGLGMSVSGSVLTVQPGYWRITNVLFHTTTTTNFTLQPQDSVLSRYETVYADSANTLHIAVGGLSLNPVEPNIPSGDLRVGAALIQPLSATTPVIITQPGAITDYVFSHPKTKQSDAYPKVRSITADSIMTPFYILPVTAPHSGDVIQAAGDGTTFWSPQAIYNQGTGILISSNIVKADTILLVTQHALLDTLRAHTAIFNPGQFTVIHDTISYIGGGGGSDSTLYKTDDSIHNTDRTVDLKLHTLLFHGQSATDSVALSIDHSNGFSIDHYNKLTHRDGNLYISSGFFDGEAIDSIGNRADIAVTSSARNSLVQLLAVNNSTVKTSQLTINTNASATGAPNGFTVLDDIYHRGISYTSYTDYINADSLTLMPKQWIEANFAPIAGGGYVPTSRTLTINGTALDLSANRSWSVGTVTLFAKTDGFGIISSVANPTTTPNHTIGVDSTLVGSKSWALAAFNTKAQDASTYVPLTRTITINGTTLDLSANRSWTVGSSVTPVSGEIPTGTINGTNPTFTIAHTPISGSVSVYINGLMERPTTDWTISGTTLTMIDIPATGDNLMVTYQY